MGPVTDETQLQVEKNQKKVRKYVFSNKEFQIMNPLVIK